MLKDKLEAARESGCKTVPETGGCRFCGQTEAVEVPVGWSMEDVNELVTERCECLEAQSYASRKRRKERAHRQIDYLFGENENTGFEPVNGQAVELLHDVVEKVGDENILSASIDAGQGIKATVKLMDKGMIKVTRTMTTKNTYEA